MICGCGDRDEDAEDTTSSSSSGLPAEPSHEYCATFDNPEACEAVVWSGLQTSCIWRDVVTVGDGQSCADGTHEFRCLLGMGQGAGCSPSCGDPNYGLIWWREASPGVFEVAGGCEIIPAEPWQQCGPYLAGCECGCDVDCSEPYC